MADQLGYQAVGATVRFSFTTKAASGAPIAPSTAFEAGDLRIYKDGSATQRSSASGVTVTAAFGSVVGLQRVAIDLSDNADPGFYADGSVYEVVLVPNDETVDGTPVMSVLARFPIGTAPVRVLSVATDAINAAALNADTGLKPDHGGTAQAGGAQDITFDNGASDQDGFYANSGIRLVGGTGAGQSNIVTGYTGTSRLAAVQEPWVVVPDNTTVFVVFPSAASVADIAAAVWTAGTRSLTEFDAAFRTGYALSAAGVLAIWDALVASFAVVGSVGRLLVDNIDASISSRASQASVSALNNLSAAETETAATAALLAYDPPTRTEATSDKNDLDGAITAAAGALASLVGTLNNLSSAQAQTAAAAALAAYDPPTNAEMEARTLSGALIARLSAHLSGVLLGVVGTGSTLTALVLDPATGINSAPPSPADDLYNDRVIIFLTGALANSGTEITDYVGATGTMTVVAGIAVPQPGDTFLVV